MAQVVATVFGEDGGAWVVHPLGVEMFLDEREEGGFDVDAVQFVDGVHEKAVGGLASACADDEDVFGVRMEEHWGVSGHDLMGFFAAPLPPFVNFKFEIIVALHNGHVGAVPFTIGNEVSAFADEVGRDFCL